MKNGENKLAKLSAKRWTIYNVEKKMFQPAAKLLPGFITIAIRSHPIVAMNSLALGR